MMCRLVFVSNSYVVPPSPLSQALVVWAHELKGDFDADFLLDGIAEGFFITNPGSRFVPVDCKNYSSATCAETADKVERQINIELEAGRYIKVCDKPTIVSSIGAVPKSDPGKIRIIHDCSRPLGKNLNSYATVSAVQYDTVDQATRLLTPGGFMAKIDLHSAYRSVPIHRECYDGTGLKWTFAGQDKPTYLIDSRLPFGASMSPGVFQRLTSSVQRMMRRRGYEVLVYLDDFLILGATAEKCYSAFNALVSLLDSLGFTINWGKVIYPCQKLVFLGVVIDSVNRTLALPDNKLQNLRLLLQTWRRKKRATKQELQQLLGKLNWAARVIKSGRTFVRRLIDLMCSVKRKHHHVRLTASARADIAWWSHFCTLFNGTANFIADQPVPDHMFTTDACSFGGAAYYGGDWFYTNWRIDFPSIFQTHINMKELFTVVLATRRWADAWRDLHVVVYTDNQTTQHLINKATSRDPTVMSWLREIFWWSATRNFLLTARYIPGHKNVISDTLSRLHDRHHWQRLLSVVPLPTFQDPHGNISVNFYGHVTKECFAHLQMSMC